MPSRGELWFADLESVKGHEQGGQRPVLIFSVDLFNNGPSTLVVVIPLTTKNRNIPFHIEINPPEGSLDRASCIMCDHIRSISRNRLINRLGKISENTMFEVAEKVTILLGI